MNLIILFIAFIGPIAIGQIIGMQIIDTISSLYNLSIDANKVRGSLIRSLLFIISMVPLYWLNYFIINKLFDINIIIYVKNFEYHSSISFIAILSIFFASIMATILTEIIKLKYEKSGEDIRQKIKILENEKECSK